jgi:hypothetical protein
MVTLAQINTIFSELSSVATYLPFLVQFEQVLNSWKPIIDGLGFSNLTVGDKITKLLTIIIALAENPTVIQIVQQNHSASSSPPQ